MTTTKKILLSLGVSALFLLPILAYGAVLGAWQGGTGISTTTAGNVGNFLRVSSSSPFLTYDFAPAAGASVATTTINGAQCPTFTFSIVDTYGASSITTSTCNILLNLLKLTSSSQITVSPTGTINFASPVVTSFNGQSGAVTGVSSMNFFYGDLSLDVRASGSVPFFERDTGAPMYIDFPVQGSNFYAPSTTIPTNNNQLTNGSNFVTSATTTYSSPLSNSSNVISCPTCSTVSTSSVNYWSAAQHFSVASTTNLYSASSSLSGNTYISNALDWGGNKYVTSTTGGTGSVSTSSPITANRFPYWTGVNGTLSGTSSLAWGTNLQVLSGDLLDPASNKYVTSTSGGSVAGSPTQVQYNEAGSFAARGSFVFVSSTDRLSLSTSTPSLIIGSTTSNFNWNASGTPSGAGVAQTATFVYGTALQTWTVPANTSSATFHVWGARGGTNAPLNLTSEGGSSSGTISGLFQGQVFYVAVGAQATSNVATEWGSGSAPASGNGARYAGGGYSAVFTANSAQSSTLLVMAGGGGGGANTDNSGSNGAGGGLSANAGAGGSGSSAGGGTQTAGGAAGVGTVNGTIGKSFQGGTGGQSTQSGGGGGGGYWGGGGAAGEASSNSGSGGGGSGYVGTSTLMAGSTSTQTSATTTNPNGRDGFVMIAWTPTIGTPAIATSTFPTMATGTFAGVAVSGDLVIGGVATTTLTSCGTNPFINGTNALSLITVGNSSVTSCKGNFSKTYKFKPLCVAFNTTSLTLVRATTTVSTFTITSGSSVANDEIVLFCPSLSP